MEFKNIDREKAIIMIDLCSSDDVRESLKELIKLGATQNEIKAVLTEVYSVDFDDKKKNIVTKRADDEIIQYNIEDNMEKVVIAVALSYTIGKQFNEFNHKTVDVDRINEVVDHILVDGTKTMEPKIAFIKSIIQDYITPDSYDAALNFANKYPCNYGTYNKYMEIVKEEKENKYKRRSK